jgi:hypothetical protein
MNNTTSLISLQRLLRLTTHLLFIFFLIWVASTVLAQPNETTASDIQSNLHDGTDVLLPEDGDMYSELVRRAHAQDQSVDFRAIRFAYLESQAFQRANKRSEELAKLRKDMFAAVEVDDDQQVRENAQEILSVEYINLDAQKLLKQSCKLMGDDACAARHRFVGLGLLRSIVSSGDGKSCDTAWEVVLVAEEYFVLRMIDTTLGKQSVVEENGHVCDEVQVFDKANNPRTYYFNVDKIFSNHEASK